VRLPNWSPRSAPARHVTDCGRCAAAMATRFPKGARVLPRLPRLSPPKSRAPGGNVRTSRRQTRPRRYATT